MRFRKYIKDKIFYILGFVIYCVLMILYAKGMNVSQNFIMVATILASLFFLIGFFMSYYKKNKYIKEIEKIMDGLPEKYLLSEVMEKPRREENLAYYKILKKSNKAMLEKVTDVRMAQKDYKEYIESWVHEIKIPITSIKLLCENNPSEVTNKINEEIEEINNDTEQVLFYARLDQVSNDFMIRKINLEEAIRTVLARNKKIMIQNHMRVETKNINITAYTDEKWLEFIINQIMINAINYRKETSPKILIEAQEKKENVTLSIQDNGIGIKKSEIDRIFDKGFTGTNGRMQKKSTGIGLYLCKRLCEQLGMTIEAESKENEYTKIKMVIPRTKKITET